ncbi:hypothetical protein D3C87_1811820 [compost metagenome]
MRMATRLGRAVHRLDFRAERQIDGSAENRFTFQGKHPAFGKAGRGARNEFRGRTDDRITGKTVAKTDRGSPIDARIGGKLGQDRTIDQR